MTFTTRIRTALAALAIAAAAAPATAAFYVDDTTGSPTYNRPLADLSGLSAVGTDVLYDVFAFTVSLAGDYRVRSFAEGVFKDAAWDQMLFLYAGAFDAAAPLANALIGNDDLDGIGRSGFDVSLSADTTYYLVTTGFGNEDGGRYLNVIRGPGEVIPVVPEPETYALLAAGLMAVAFAVRRRRAPDA